MTNRLYILLFIILACVYIGEIYYIDFKIKSDNSFDSFIFYKKSVFPLGANSTYCEPNKATPLFHLHPAGVFNKVDYFNQYDLLTSIINDDFISYFAENNLMILFHQFSKYEFLTVSTIEREYYLLEELNKKISLPIHKYFSKCHSNEKN